MKKADHCSITVTKLYDALMLHTHLKPY